MMPETDGETIETRVMRTLERLGYTNVQVNHLGEGKVAIISDTKRDDQCMIKAATQTVAGVTTVSVKSK